MFVFQKIWCALFSWNTCFEICPFALLPTKCSVILFSLYEKVVITSEISCYKRHGSREVLSFSKTFYIKTWRKTWVSHKMKDYVELFKENKNMAVEKKLRVMISFYKNQCPPVIMWNKRNLSEKVLPITYTLELKIFVVTTFCESIFFR